MWKLKKLVIKSFKSLLKNDIDLIKNNLYEVTITGRLALIISTKITKFKDLDKKSFFKAKEIFKKEKFEDEILVDHIALAKENKKGRWKECKKFEF